MIGGGLGGLVEKTKKAFSGISGNKWLNPDPEPVVEEEATECKKDDDLDHELILPREYVMLLNESKFCEEDKKRFDAEEEDI